MSAHRLGFTFWMVLGVAAGQHPEVTVRIFNYAGTPESVLEKATLEAQRLLNGAEITTRWVECPLRAGPVEPRHLACMALTNPADVVLRIVPPNMQGVRNVGHSLGFSMPFTGERLPTRAYVLYEHVRERIRTYEGVSEARLLGYVLAHEVAHLLFGDERHSRSGIMMANWRERELSEIERGSLAFSADDARLLQAGAAVRTQPAGQQ